MAAGGSELAGSRASRNLRVLGRYSPSNILFRNKMLVSRKAQKYEGLCVEGDTGFGLFVLPLSQVGTVLEFTLPPEAPLGRPREGNNASKATR